MQLIDTVPSQPVSNDQNNSNPAVLQQAASNDDTMDIAETENVQCYNSRPVNANLPKASLPTTENNQTADNQIYRIF